MKKLLLVIFTFGLIGQAYAYTLNVGVFGGADSRDQVDDGSIYGFSATILWGGKDFKMGLGAHKALQNINGVYGGYETLSLNIQYGGFFINPFYGRRAIKTSDLFKSNNLYPTKGVTFGYDYLISKNVSLGVMGIYENPEELDSNETNSDFVKLKSTVSPAITLKFWWW